MKILIIGVDGFIGSVLNVMLSSKITYLTHEIVGTSRRRSGNGIIYFDLAFPTELPKADVTYICAAMTRFIECEDNFMSYRTNVDGPIWVTQKQNPGLVVYLSSEAVERAIHTAYGMQKALTEIYMRSQPNTCVVRLPKVTDVEDICGKLIGIGETHTKGLVRLNA